MSSLVQSSSGSEESGAEELYFSFGSNMQLKQMAARCPDSRLYGKGILPAYKWQINNRGGGNVIEGNREDFVEGIIFTVPTSEVQTLRHYEGVKKGFYAECKLDIEVQRISDTALEGRKTADAAAILAQYRSSAEQNHKKSNGGMCDAHLETSREYPATSHRSGLVSSASKGGEQGPSILQRLETTRTSTNDKKRATKCFERH